MSDKKIITVFGATGAQGGSVVKALLTDPKTKAEWHVRAVTRDVTKPSAQALKDLGAEPVSVITHAHPSTNHPLIIIGQHQ